jgi:hypothetical protein
VLRAVMPLSRTSGEEVVQTYMIVGRDDGAGYNVELTDAIGVHHTILGFETEAEAQDWIEQTKGCQSALLRRLQLRASRSGSLLSDFHSTSAASTLLRELPIRAPLGNRSPMRRALRYQAGRTGSGCP